MRNTIIALALVALGFSFYGAPSYAEGELKVGYVDFRKVMTESKAGKRNRTVVEKMVKQGQSKLTKKGKELDALRQAYEKKKLVLTEDQKKEKQQEFQKKLQAYQKMRADLEQKIRKREAEYGRKAAADIKGIISEIAKAKKISLVFNKNRLPVLYAVDGPDLTAEVMKRYNAKFGK